MEKKKKFKPADAVSDINVTPMVDIMLVVLIIFMVITPMITKGVPVEMAKSNNPIAMSGADKEDAIVIAISRDGKAYLGSGPVNPSDLTPKIKSLMETKTDDKTIYIKADARARYERVTDVVDNLRAAGIDQIGLLTERIKKNADGSAPAGMP